MKDARIFYLIGALHDGYVYVGKRKGKVAVFTQKNRKWLENVARIIQSFGYNSWIFKQRNIFALETKFPPLLENHKIWNLNLSQQIEYVSGFFDAEGGLPKNPKNSKTLYIQFVQKDKKKLEIIKSILENLCIKIGKIHQYDKKSGCYRFFISRKSLLSFVKIINSKHPDKISRLKKLKNRLLKRQTR